MATSRKRERMMNKIVVMLTIIIVVLNFVWDLVFPPTHIYRNLIVADICCIVWAIAFVLMWRKTNGR